MRRSAIAAVALAAACASTSTPKSTTVAVTEPQPVEVAAPPAPEPVVVAAPTAPPQQPAPNVTVTTDGQPLPPAPEGGTVTRVKVRLPPSAAPTDERADQNAAAVTEAEQRARDAEQQRDEAAQRTAQAEEKAKAEEQARLDAENRAADLEKQLATLAGVQETERGLVVTLSGDVIFEFDRAALLPPAEQKLDRLAEMLKTTDRKLAIEGHTDGVGGDAYNEQLSYRRASSVRDHLIARGVPAERMAVSGFGESRPIADNGSPEGRAMNRRVEIIILKPTE